MVKLGPNIIDYIFIIIVCFLFYSKIVFSPLDYAFFGSDWSFFMSKYLFLKKSVERSLQIPMWNYEPLGGMPFITDPNFFPLYITTPLIVSMDEVMSIRISVFIHLLLAGIFMCYILKKLGIGRYGSLLGSFVYMFNGMILSKIYVGHHNVIIPYAWIPLTFFFFHKGIEDKKLKFLILGSIAFGLEIFAGGIFIAYQTLIFIIVFFLLNHIEFRKSDMKKILFLSSFLIFTFLFAAVRIMPMLEFTKFAYRVETEDVNLSLVGSMSLNDIFNSFFSRSPLNLQKIGNSYYFWEFWSYFGIAFLFLIFSIFLSRKRFVFSLAILILFFVLISMGKNSPLNIYEFFYKNLPYFNFFKIPSRFTYLLPLPVSILSAMGLNEIEKRVSTWKRNPVVTLIPLILIIVVLIDFYSVSRKGSIISEDLIPISPIKNYYRFLDFIVSEDSNTSEYRVNNKVTELDHYNLFKRDLNSVSGYEPVRFNYLKAPDITYSKNIKYLISDKEISQEGYFLENTINGINIYRNLNFVPRAHMIVDDEIVNYKVNMYEYTPNKICLEANNSKNNTKLELSDPNYPGWEVYVNGRKSKVEGITTRITYLESGYNKVCFVFRNISFIIGLAITSVFSFFVIIYFVKDYLRT